MYTSEKMNNKLTNNERRAKEIVERIIHHMSQVYDLINTLSNEDRKQLESMFYI